MLSQRCWHLIQRLLQLITHLPIWVEIVIIQWQRICVNLFERFLILVMVVRTPVTVVQLCRSKIFLF